MYYLCTKSLQIACGAITQVWRIQINKNKTILKGWKSKNSIYDDVEYTSCSPLKEDISPAWTVHWASCCCLSAMWCPLIDSPSIFALSLGNNLWFRMHFGRSCSSNITFYQQFTVCHLFHRLLTWVIRATVKETWSKTFHIPWPWTKLKS